MLIWVFGCLRVCVCVCVCVWVWVCAQSFYNRHKTEQYSQSRLLLLLGSADGSLDNLGRYFIMTGLLLALLRNMGNLKDLSAI